MIRVQKSFFSIVLLFSLLSCNKDETASFNVSEAATVELPGASVSGIIIQLNSETFLTDFEVLLEDNNTTQVLIETTVLEQITLSLIEPEETSLNFLDQVTVYLKDGNGDTLLISKTDTLSSADKAARTIDVSIKQRDNFIDWISKPSLSYIVKASINDFYTDKRSFEVKAAFRVDGALNQ